MRLFWIDPRRDMRGQRSAFSGQREGRRTSLSELPVEPLDDPDDDPLFVFAKPFTASRRVSGSTVSPVHADLIVTSCGVLGRPRPSFLADGQLSVPGMRHRCETSFVPLSPPMASLNATAMGFASDGDNARTKRIHRVEVARRCLDDIRRLQREPVQADSFFADVGVEVADQG